MSKYRTAMGRTVDMGAMATRNEKTRAVGNTNYLFCGLLIKTEHNLQHSTHGLLPKQYC